MGTDQAKPAVRRLWQFWRWKLHWQILLGLVLGAGGGFLLGWVAVQTARQDPTITASHWVQNNYLFATIKLIGDLFLNGLKLVMIPLITSSIALSIAGIAQQRGFGRLGLKTLAYFLFTSTIAIFTGLLLVNTIRPGVSASGQPLLDVKTVEEQFQREGAALAAASGQAAQRLGETVYERVLGVMRELLPPNGIQAAAETNLLGLIVISMLIGYFMSRLSGKPAETFQAFWEAVYGVSISVTNFILRFAPLGIGALIVKALAENYASLAQENRFDDLIGSLLLFVLVAILGLAFHMLVTLPLILSLVARVNPLKHYRAMFPAMLTAFSTSSSNATLPVTLECVEVRAGVSRSIASFVLPLGATANMNGTALYECVAAMFVVQLFGVQLDLPLQFLVVLIALLTSIGVAGVPSASLVAIVIILQSLSTSLQGQGKIDFDLAAGLPILLVFDRPLDMLRTAVNVFSDSVGAVVVARTEGEQVPYAGEVIQQARTDSN